LTLKQSPTRGVGVALRLHPAPISLCADLRGAWWPAAMLVRLCAAACCLLERGSKGAASDFCIWEREEIAAAVARGERARAREVAVAGGRE
jgi:hypothetical protein